MSVREYIGARYVPIFADPIEWDNSLVYEPLTVVKYQGASYVSRKSVPEGIAIDNEDYWILWADYNAQLQHYIDTVNTFDGRIDTLEDKFPIDTADIADDAVTAAKIDDGAVGTAALADDAVTAAKIDDSYTQHFTDLVKDTDLKTTKMEYLPIITDGWHTFKSGYYTSGDGTRPNAWQLRASTVGKDNDLFIFLTKSNSDSGDIVVINRGANTVDTYAVNIDMGHANEVFYSPVTEQFYILPGYSNVSESDPDYKNCIFVYDNDFTNKRIYDAPNSYGWFGFVGDSIVFAAFDGKTYDYNEQTHEFTLRDTVLDPIPNTLTDSYIPTYVFQGGIIYDGLLYVAIGWNGLERYPNCIAVWDISSGNYVKTYILPTCSDIMPAGEVQDIGFDSTGTMFLFNQSAFERYAEETLLVVFTSGIRANYPIGTSYSSILPTDIDVEVTPSDTVYRPFVTSNAYSYNFKTIREALTYAKHHNVRNIVVYPTYNDSSNIYWFDELVMVDGLDVSLILNANVGFDMLWSKGNSTVRVEGTLNVRIPANFPWGSSIGVYMKNSTIYCGAVKLHDGFSNAYRWGVLLEGAGAMFANTSPVFEGSATGTLISDIGTIGYKLTKFS